jgi:hypothetical protein
MMNDSMLGGWWDNAIDWVGIRTNDREEGERDSEIYNQGVTVCQRY